MLTLRWSTVDLQQGCILLTKTKNGSAERDPIYGTALDVLRQHARVRRIDSDLLYPCVRTGSLDLPFSFDQFGYWTLAEMKITNFRFQDLRHSAASYLAISGASLLEIAGILGHRTLQMVKRYSHLSDSHTSEVVDRMNRKFLTQG